MLNRMVLSALLVAVALPPAMAKSIIPVEVHPLVILPALPAQTAVTEEAAALATAAYEEATVKHAASDLTGALDAANRAYAAVPNASTAVIRATLLGEIGRHRDAFEAYLVASELEPTDDERRLIDEGLAAHGAACVPPLGWARVQVSPAGTAVQLSGTTVKPPRIVGLSAGSHDVRLAAKGYEEQMLSLDVRTGKETVAQFMLGRPVPKPEVVATPVSTTPPTAVEKSPPVVPWVLVGSGAAVALGGLGINLWALDAAATRDSYATPGAGGLSETERQTKYEAAQKDAETRAVVSYVMYGVGGATVVAGVVLLLLPEDDVPSAVRATPFLSSDTAGFALSGSF